MKILRILFICFVVLYMIITWVDDDVPFKPVYWLIFKLTCTFITVLAMGFIRFKSNEDGKPLSVLSFCFWLIYFGYFFGYKEIVKYNRNTCQDKFGLVFNKNRRMLGVPEIPDNWRIEYRFDGRVVWWKGKKDTIGHVSKHISLDSGCKIDYESDQYNFKSIKGVSRYLSITTQYSHGEDVDSIVYYYERGNDNQKISLIRLS